MPREFTLRTVTPITLIEVVLAANSVDPQLGIRGIGGTDTIQIFGPDDSPIVMILPSIELSAPSPFIDVDPVADVNAWLVWTEALAPWRSSSDHLDRLFDQLVQMCGGHVFARSV